MKMVLTERVQACASMSWLRFVHRILELFILASALVETR